MKHKFTILTPTHNRSELLPRLYKSIKEQTYKDFVWLVINDHSVDSTLDVLNEMKSEGVVDMKIVNNPSPKNGKHTVLKYGFELCDTPYLVDIDDDDELLPNALEVFNNEWSEIEREGKSYIGSIRALTVDELGQIVGDISKNKLFEPFEASYLDVTYQRKLKIENLTCFCVTAVREAKIFPVCYYLQGQETHLAESIFWGRLSRMYQSKYIPNVLRLYHYSASSIIRHSKTRQYYLNLLVGGKILFEEQNDYLKKSPILYLRWVFIIGLLSCALGLSYYRLMKNMKRGKVCLAILFLPCFMLSYIWFRFRIK